MGSVPFHRICRANTRRFLSGGVGNSSAVIAARSAGTGIALTFGPVLSGARVAVAAGSDPSAALSLVRIPVIVAAMVGASF